MGFTTKCSWMCWQLVIQRVLKQVSSYPPCGSLKWINLYFLAASPLPNGNALNDSWEDALAQGMEATRIAGKSLEALEALAPMVDQNAVVRWWLGNLPWLVIETMSKDLAWCSVARQNTISSALLQTLNNGWAKRSSTGLLYMEQLVTHLGNGRTFWKFSGILCQTFVPRVWDAVRFLLVVMAPIPWPQGRRVLELVR